MRGSHTWFAIALRTAPTSLFRKLLSEKWSGPLKTESGQVHLRPQLVNLCRRLLDVQGVLRGIFGANLDEERIAHLLADRCQHRPHQPGKG